MFRAAFRQIFNPAALARLQGNYDTARSLMDQGHLLQARILFKQILDEDPNCEGAFRRIVKIDLMLEKQNINVPPKNSR